MEDAKEATCKQERFSSKAQGSILHLHPFNWGFVLFYQWCGKKLALIRSADDPEIAGTEISRKAGPRVLRAEQGCMCSTRSSLPNPLG